MWCSILLSRGDKENALRVEWVRVGRGRAGREGGKERRGRDLREEGGERRRRKGKAGSQGREQGGKGVGREERKGMEGNRNVEIRKMRKKKGRGMR